MKPITCSIRLVGSCGLYCGACPWYRLDKCSGCHGSSSENDGKFLGFWLRRCGIRRCCHSQGFVSCADCSVADMRSCATYNGFFNRLVSRLINSDRPAAIRYIRRHGYQVFANRMTLHEQIAIKVTSEE